MGLPQDPLTGNICASARTGRGKLKPIKRHKEGMMAKISLSVSPRTVSSYETILPAGDTTFNCKSENFWSLPGPFFCGRS